MLGKVHLQFLPWLDAPYKSMKTRQDVLNLCENDLDGIISAVKPESNNSPALAELGSPDVTVWIILSILVHVTVLPASIVIGFGEYD